MVGYRDKLTTKDNTMTFKYDKENLFKEFEVAKQKDFKLSKKQKQDDIENDYFTNRIQFMKDHIELKKTNPDYYEFLDINFDNLLKAYESVNPRDYFYTTVFGMTYAQKKRQEDAEYFNLSDDDDDNQKTKTRNIEEATL